MEFHKKLKAFRTAQGKTQGQLASILEINVRLYQSYEYGKIKPFL